MAFDESVMDSTVEVIIPISEVRFKDRDGVTRQGVMFRDFFQVKFADGSEGIIPSPLKNLEFHDGNTNGLGHGLVVYRLENVAPDQEDGTRVHVDASNP